MDAKMENTEREEGKYKYKWLECIKSLKNRNPALCSYLPNSISTWWYINIY
jgi:hypothetical protein